MIERIKRSIIEYYGEPAWFLLVLKHGSWEFFPAIRYRYDQYRISFGSVLIDIQDMQGHYCIAVGYRGGLLRVISWDDMVITDTSEKDTAWVSRVHQLLSHAHKEVDERKARYAGE